MVGKALPIKTFHRPFKKLMKVVDSLPQKTNKTKQNKTTGGHTHTILQTLSTGSQTQNLGIHQAMSQLVTGKGRQDSPLGQEPQMPGENDQHNRTQ